MAGTVRRSLPSGEDVWVEAVRLLQIVARASSLDEATRQLRVSMLGLDKAAVKDLVVALAVIPRFALWSDIVASPVVLEEFQLQMAWAWPAPDGGDEAS